MKLNKNLFFIYVGLLANILQAAQTDLRLIKNDLNAGRDPNKEFMYISNKYSTEIIEEGLPLHVGVEFGDKELAELALQKGAKINLRDREGRTPLRMAVLENRAEMIELLIKNGADIKSEDSAVSLETAVESEYIEVVKTLLAHGVSVNTKVNNYSLLQRACTMGSFKIVDLLIEKGAHVNYEAYGRLVPLMYTVDAVLENKKPERISEYIAIVNLLLKNGADINKGAIIEQGICTWNILDKAFGDYGVMKLLLLQGIKPTKSFLDNLILAVDKINSVIREFKDDESKKAEYLEAHNERRLYEEIKKIIELQDKITHLTNLVDVEQEQIGLLKERIDINVSLNKKIESLTI